MNEEIEKYCKKLENYYDSEGKLIQYPSKKPMRMMALAKIAAHFKYEQNYTEKEVNEIIKNHIAFNDIELIRRELFQYKMISRLRDGSKYWAEPGWQDVYSDYI